MNNTMRMPADYIAVSSAEQQALEGGRYHGYDFGDFVAYLLSGFTLSFGSGTAHTNSDTVTSTDGSHYGTTGTTVHTNVDNISSGQHMNWNANFNLGGIFRAFLWMLR